MSRNVKAKGRFLRTCRTLHGWLGVFVLPWVIVIGATGFYLNHSKLILAWLPQAAFSEADFDKVRPPAPITADQARALGETIWPEDAIKEIVEEAYHGRPSFVVKKRQGSVILSISTGHQYIKTRYRRRTYSPDGVLLHTKVYWGTVFKDLHRSGWLGWSLGTWLADAVSLAMVFFGLTGAMMWWFPRAKKLGRFFKRGSPGTSTDPLSLREGA